MIIIEGYVQVDAKEKIYIEIWGLATDIVLKTH